MSTQVTINDVPPKTQITATAGQTVFTTNWTANVASDVVVYARTSAQEPDDLTQEVSSANYTVAFIGGSEIVEVTFLVGRAAGDVVTITRDTPADRLNLYTNTNFTPSMLNQDVGILTLVDQQAQLYNTQVAPHYNVSSTPDLGDPITGLGGDIYLPILSANEGWKKNSANTAIEAITFPTSGGLAPSDATYILQTPWSPGSELPNSQPLSPLATGFMSSVNGTGVVSTRTLQGTANQINVTNGTGTGNPVFSLSNALQLPGTMTFGGNVDANGYNISNIGQANIGNIQIFGNTISGVSDINDSNNNTAILVGAAVSAVNYLQINNAPTNNPVTITAQGSDVNVSLYLAGKGSSQVRLGSDLLMYNTSGGNNYTIFSTVATGTKPVTIPDLSGTMAISGASQSVSFGQLDVDNVQINGNTISSTDTNGDLILTPNGTGDLVLDGLNWPQADGTNGQAITTNGAGQLGWTSFGAPYTPAALTEVNDTNVTMTLGGTPATALLQAVSMTLGWTGQLNISRGGTNASTIGANGTIAQSDGTKYTFTTATYPSTATATGTILRADGTNWVATTATYPATTTINQILYSSANNTINEIATTVGGVLVTNSTGVPSMLANPADNYRVLQSKNAAIPEWSVAAYPHTASTAGTLMQSDGTDWTHTQATYPSITNKDHILYSSANNTVGEIATQKDAVLVSNHSNTPVWSSSMTDGQIIIGKTNDIPAAANLTAGTGISITNGPNSIAINATGGTVNSGTANQLAYYATTGTAVSGLSSANSATLVTNSTGVPSWTSSMTNGQILIGSTGATPVPATLTAGPGVSIANAAGSITISGTGSGIGWTEVTGTSQTMSADNGYVSSNAGLVTLTLPTTAAFGTVISIVGKGAGGWKIAQNAGQNIQLGSSSSTVGVAGYIASTNQFDSIDLLCTTANTTWTVQGGPQGNITVA